jgi:hypothetical protein
MDVIIKIALVPDVEVIKTLILMVLRTNLWNHCELVSYKLQKMANHSLVQFLERITLLSLFYAQGTLT